MNKDEAVQKLATAGRLSIAHAEDLYDSLFPRPVVPQYVADWYEANKRNLNLNLCGFVFDRAINSTNCYREDFKEWVNDNKKTFITTLVNMHQFGYTVEKEPRYTVEFKGIDDEWSFLNHNTRFNDWTLNDGEETEVVRTAHTRKELEDANFGWVFDCPGVEVKEVTDD